MELTPDLFCELSEGAFYEEVPFPFVNQRAAPRVRILIEATLVRITGGATASPFPTKIRDLSARGLQVEYHEPIHVKDAFAVRLLRRDHTPLWLYCESMRWQPVNEQLFTVGARFTRIFIPPPKALTTARPAAA